MRVTGYLTEEVPRLAARIRELPGSPLEVLAMPLRASYSASMARGSYPRVTQEYL